MTVSAPVTSACAVITAVQGVAITPVTLSASGGTGTGYTFTATGLPAGLSISTGGTISGTPTVSGTFSYTVTITDSKGNKGTLNCSVTVSAPVTSACAVITAVQGVAITPVTLSASGGTGTGYTFTATGLPTGLSISTGGTIPGTPTVNGTFSYTVTIQKRGNKGTLNCSVTVSCAGHIGVRGDHGGAGGRDHTGDAERNGRNRDGLHVHSDGAAGGAEHLDWWNDSRGHQR